MESILILTPPVFVRKRRTTVSLAEPSAACPMSTSKDDAVGTVILQNPSDTSLTWAGVSGTATVSSAPINTHIVNSRFLVFMALQLLKFISV